MSNPFYKGIEFRWEEHKRLWNWLSENPEATKSDWPEWNIIGHSVNHCFACDFQSAFKEKNNVENAYMHSICNFCPLSKNSSCLIRNCLGGLYYQWAWAWAWEPIKERPALALKIANLPLRDDLDWKTSTGEPYGPR